MTAQFSRTPGAVVTSLYIACQSCYRQYDVSGMKVGERLRCLCGELAEVPARRPHEARVLHCAGCGGKVREKSSTCDYCGGAILLADRNLGPACPLCFARLTAGARYCQECGVEIRPEKFQAIRLEACCPRCKGALSRCETERGHITECTACGGLWLEESFFEQMVEKKDISPLGKLMPHEGATQSPAGEEVKYLPCPTCGGLMNRKNFGGTSGVIIDWCKGHGFWFDTHEIEKILAFVTAGGLDRARAREIARAEERARQAEKRASGSPGLPELEQTGQYREGLSFLDVLLDVGAHALGALFHR